MAEMTTPGRAWHATEERLGFPPEKEYCCLYGAYDMETVLLIRESDGLLDSLSYIFSGDK
jgi:hypothetical protein